MTVIIIRTVGNPALYRSLQESFATESRHRSISGAIRRLRWIGRQERTWRRTTGAWGRVEIEIDDRALDAGDVDFVEMAVADELRDPQFSAGAAARALSTMVEAQTAFAAECSESAEHQTS